MPIVIFSLIITAILGALVPRMMEHSTHVREKSINEVLGFQMHPVIEIGAKYGFETLGENNRNINFAYNSAAGLRGFDFTDSSSPYGNTRLNRIDGSGLVQDCMRASFVAQNASLCLSTGLPHPAELPIRLTTRNEGLNSRDVLSLYADPATSDVYAGTRDGLFLSSDGGRTFSSYSNGLPSSMVRSIFKDPEGYLWVGTDRGLSYRQIGDPSFTKAQMCSIQRIGSSADYSSMLSYINDQPVLDVVASGSDLIVAHNSKLFKMDRATLQSGGCPNALMLYPYGTVKQIAMNSNSIAIATSYGLMLCDTGFAQSNCSRKTSASNGLPSNVVNSVFWAPQPSGPALLYVGTAFGVAISTDLGTSFNRVQVPFSSDPYVTEVFVDVSLLYLIVGTREGAYVGDLRNRANSYPPARSFWYEYKPAKMRGFYVSSISKTSDALLITTDAKMTQALVPTTSAGGSGNQTIVMDESLWNPLRNYERQVNFGIPGFQYPFGCQPSTTQSGESVCGGIPVYMSAGVDPAPPRFRFKHPATRFEIDVPQSASDGQIDICAKATFLDRMWKRCVKAQYENSSLVAMSPYTETFAFNPLRKDLLFIIDESGSMGQEITIVTQELSAFVTALNSRGLFDYQIGVTTTDWRSLEGQLLTSDAALEPGASGGIQVVKSATLGAAAETEAISLFKVVEQRYNNYAVNNTTWDERGLASMEFALKDTASADPLWRDGVEASVILVTDEDDNTCLNNGTTFSCAGAFTPVSYYRDVILDLDRTILFFPTVGKPGSINGKECAEVAVIGQRYMDLHAMLGSTSTFVGSMCNNILGTQFEQIGQKLADRGTCYELPDVGSSDGIVVTIDGSSLPFNANYANDPTNGFTFDATTQSVCFNASHVPSAGSAIQITYQRLL